MTRGQVDLVDMVVYPFFLFGSLFAAGVVPGSALPINPNMVLAQLGPETSISLATAIAVLSLAVVLWTNKPRLDPYGGIQAWLVIVTAALIIAPPFVPLLSNWMAAEPLLGIVSVIIQSAGYVITSFMG